jgi:hypothetical protein
MSKLKTALDRGIRAAKSAMGPQRYQAAGKLIVCSHCGGERFTTPGMPTLVGYILDCSDCKQRLLFAGKPEWLRNENV